MTPVLKTLLLQLVLLPCSLASAQNAQKDSLDSGPPPATKRAPTNTFELVEPASVDTADPPQVHLISLKYAVAKDLAASLEKIFDANIKTGGLAIVGDSRANRLVIRASDKVYVEVRNLVEKLDMNGHAEDQTDVALPVQPQPLKSTLSPASDGDQESLLRIVQSIRDSTKDPNKVQSLQDQLVEAVQRDFAQQQQELRSELAQLRAKMDSLQALLEKREAQKNAICRKRIEAFLSTPLGELPTVRDPSFLNPLSSPKSGDAEKASRRSTPLNTNTNLDAETIPEEITTILQAELFGEEGVQVRLDGTPSRLFSSLDFQLSNRKNRVEYDLTSSSGKHAVARVTLECEEADKDFWERISRERIRVTLTNEELDRVDGSQMITKCVYLPKERGKGLTWLVWDQVDAGVDIREKSKQLGDLVLTVTLTRPGVATDDYADPKDKAAVVDSPK